MISRWVMASVTAAVVTLFACGGGTSTGTGPSGPLGAGGSTNAGNGGSGGGGGAGACLPSKTLNVTASGFTAYVIDGVSNPDFTFCRGTTYTFAVNASGHPFYIKTVQSTGVGNAYSSGVTGNGTDSGTVTFVVPADAPATLFYDCSLHASMTGTIHIID